MRLDQKREWRRTSFRRPDGSIEKVSTDWTLSNTAGQPIARIYRYVFGANAGRWAWLILAAPDEPSCNEGAGLAASEAEAREACEARVPA